jgi:tetratricopeptide (TPR) repeat protein
MNEPRSRPLAAALLALLAAVPVVAAAQDPATSAGPPVAPATTPSAVDRQVAAYQAFQREFSAGRFESALPLARELVTIIETADPLSDELPTAYNNLGVVQFRTRDLAGAEASFARALDLLEGTQGISSRRLVSPLAGLGAVYAAQGQHARAVDVLQRAIAISRRADGLFNLDQLDMLDAAIRSYEALGVTEGVERESRYALQIVQQQYGFDDPRTLPVVTKLAGWYEKTERYVSARALWIRAVEIASKEGNGRNAATINGLLGVARTHRLQYARDPGSMEGAVVIDPLTGRPDPLMNTAGVQVQAKLNREGEAAAQRALEILESTPEPPKALMARALLELGDWYITAHDPARAVPYYERAWPLLGEMLAPGEQNPLASPRPLHYRPPPATTRNLGRPDQATITRKMEFNVDIGPTGEVTGVTPLPSGATANQTATVRRALEKAWFSPRFEDGKPLATTGFLFAEYWVEIAPEPPPGDEAKDSAAAGKNGGS